MKGNAVSTGASSGEHTAIDVHGVFACIQSVLVMDDGPFRLSETAPLAEFLDSFSLVQLVVALEDKFKVGFSQAELLDEANWKTALTIVSLLKHKRMDKAA